MSDDKKNQNIEIKEEEKIDKEEKDSQKEPEPKKNEPITLEKINELLTNNLKWSQIIYEQNRKINRKLFWASFFDYLKMALIVIPLVIGFFYLLPSMNNLLQTVGALSMTQDGTLNQQGVSLDALLNQLPFDQAKKEQLKALLR